MGFVFATTGSTCEHKQVFSSFVKYLIKRTEVFLSLLQVEYLQYNTSIRHENTVFNKVNAHRVTQCVV